MLRHFVTCLAENTGDDCLVLYIDNNCMLLGTLDWPLQRVSNTMQSMVRVHDAAVSKLRQRRSRHIGCVFPRKQFDILNILPGVWIDSRTEFSHRRPLCPCHDEYFFIFLFFSAHETFTDIAWNFV